MCAIIGWCGELPPKFLELALERAETRGRDATGIAWREGPRTNYVKAAFHAGRFVQAFSKDVKTANNATRGIAHVRRASPGMMRNDENAHPFCHEKLVYAHNGTIRNWLELSTLRGVEVSTDSMLLGYNITERDFTNVVGTASLVWIDRDNVRCIRIAKELVGANIRWACPKRGAGQFSVVASTRHIIESGLDYLTADATIDIQWLEMEHATCFILEQDNIYSEGMLPFNVNCLAIEKADSHTSKELPK